MAHLTGTAKARFVSRMFGRIAQRYDLLNGMMSLCQARRWRRIAAESAAPASDGMALDIATGTGDLALELAALAGGQVVASDFSEEMLQRARTKAAEAGIEDAVTFILADAHQLPFSDGAFTCATVAFGVRNFTNPLRALAELRRVVRQDGRVVCLELVRPNQGVRAALYHLYLRRVVPALGELVSGDGEAYQYLPESVRSFLTAGELQAMMESTGLRAVHYRTMNWGTVAVHVGVK